MQKPDFLKGRKGITFVDLFAGAGGFSEGKDCKGSSFSSGLLFD